MKSWAARCGLLVLVLAASTFDQALAKDASPVQTRLEAEAGRGKLNGVVLISKDDKVVFQSSIGEVNRATHLKADIKTPWRLASISKQITAVLVMQAVEQGRLRLGQTVGSVLPSFERSPSAGVTVQQLLQHTSGLPDPSETPETSAGVPVFYTRDKADHGFCAGTPRAAPGDFHYNNCDFYVLSDILATVTGMSYARLVQNRIAKPLGLKTLHVYAAGEPEVFRAVGEGEVAEPPYHMSAFEAAAGLTASAEDLLKFDQALMSGRLLKPESLSRLWAGDPKLGYVALGAWAYTVKPSGCKEALTLVERRGAVGDVNVLNLLWPQRHAALIVFSSNGETDWGQLWQDSGLMRDLAVAAWCTE